jgi:colanic acid biosynthesis glycosyl transferase WcaI
MKILLLNLYYPPDTSATAKMAATVVEALSAQHDVTVLCGRPSYDPTERRPWRLWQAEFSGRLRILRMGSTDYPRFAMKRRVLNYLSYVALAIPRALFVPCDVVLAMTDPPFEGIVGAIVALLKAKPYVYNIRDMYPDMAVGGAIVEPGLLARVWERLHRWALRRATRVIVLGEDMRARIVAKGVDAARVEIVRDGTEILPPGAPQPALDSEVIRAIRGDFKFVFLHAGNLGFYGAWETLIEATRQLEKSNPDVGLVFVGDGAQRDRMVALADECKSIRFVPFFPASKIPSVMAAGDVHVITVKKGLEGVVVPSKLYGTLAAGRPILAVADVASDVSVIAQEKKCGYAASPQIPLQVFMAMRAMAAEGRDAPGLKAMGEAARAIAPDYDRVKELQKFVKIIEGAVNA